VFPFVGSSGIGKTETALALADVLYSGEKKLITITINMSEYQQAHLVSGLKGSPPVSWSVKAQECSMPDTSDKFDYSYQIFQDARTTTPHPVSP
jgi:ABC-type dipeptide/oligopeptide/nickel transport system ATPase component